MGTKDDFALNTGGGVFECCIVGSDCAGTRDMMDVSCETQGANSRDRSNSGARGLQGPLHPSLTQTALKVLIEKIQVKIFTNIISPLGVAVDLL